MVCDAGGVGARTGGGGWQGGVGVGARLAQQRAEGKKQDWFGVVWVSAQDYAAFRRAVIGRPSAVERKGVEMAPDRPSKTLRRRPRLKPMHHVVCSCLLLQKWNVHSTSLIPSKAKAGDARERSRHRPVPAIHPCPERVAGRKLCGVVSVRFQAESRLDPAASSKRRRTERPGAGCQPSERQRR